MLVILSCRASYLVFNVWVRVLFLIAAACQKYFRSVFFLLMIYQALYNIMVYALLKRWLWKLCDYIVNLATHVDIG